MIDHKNKPRPLSPHLTVYKAEYSSMLSIYHRVTGIVLAICLLLLVLVYKSQAYNIEYYALLVNFLSENSYADIILLVIYLVVVFAVFAVVYMLAYHMSNGIRHFVWDVLMPTVSKENIRTTSYAVIILSVILFIGLIAPAYIG